MRIHFTLADAMKVRVVVLGELAEVLHSFAMLQQPHGTVMFGQWRTRTVRRARVLSPDVREVARFVAPPGRGVADLFTLVGQASEYVEGIDRLGTAPAQQLREELSYAPRVAGIRSSWIGDFADGNPAARQRLVRALSDYHQVAVAPYWSQIRTVLDNERAVRLDVMARQGLGAMLAGLAPTLRWKSSVLEIPDYGLTPQANLDVRLGGRGLILAPSLFQAADPGLFIPWNDTAPILMYPISFDALTALHLWQNPGDPAGRALATLLGTTRAAALRVVADGCTTSELARRLNISPGGASQHATVLRESGLVTSRRHRNTVQHTITKLGTNLLNAS